MEAPGEHDRLSLPCRWLRSHTDATVLQVHFALGMANRCDCLVSRLSAYSEDCGEYAMKFQQAATELLDECNDMFEAEKVLLDTGHRFIKGEDPLNYALRHEFVHFVSNRWTKRYTKELWYDSLYN